MRVVDWVEIYSPNENTIYDVSIGEGMRWQVDAVAVRAFWADLPSDYSAFTELVEAYGQPQPL